MCLLASWAAQHRCYQEHDVGPGGWPYPLVVEREGCVQHIAQVQLVGTLCIFQVEPVMCDLNRSVMCA